MKHIWLFLCMASSTYPMYIKEPFCFEDRKNEREALSSLVVSWASRLPQEVQSMITEYIMGDVKGTVIDSIAEYYYSQSSQYRERIDSNEIIDGFISFDENRLVVLTGPYNALTKTWTGYGLKIFDPNTAEKLASKIFLSIKEVDIVLDKEHEIIIVSKMVKKSNSQRSKKTKILKYYNLDLKKIDPTSQDLITKEMELTDKKLEREASPWLKNLKNIYFVSSNFCVGYDSRYPEGTYLIDLRPLHYLKKFLQRPDLRTANIIYHKCVNKMQLNNRYNKEHFEKFPRALQSAIINSYPRP